VTEAERTEPLASVFEERAENLSWNELRNWTTYTSREHHIVKKLRGPGAKLVTGPRGSGKSTLLKTAYYQSLDARDALPIYVNYAKSLALEPLFHQRADAIQLFRQWILWKIIRGLQAAFADVRLSLPSGLEEIASQATTVLRAFESGNVGIAIALAPSQVVELLEEAAHCFGSERCVVLMDDAAHAFSPEQQREFFEVFRELRSRRVACKAAVYPGVTSYSPNMQVGHEAELLEAWSQPDEDDYLDGMRKLVGRRLPASYSDSLKDKQELVDYLALAAFGLPRAFLNMLADVFDVDAEKVPRPTKLKAERAVANQAQEVRGVFSALGVKLPRYSTFVAMGGELERALIRTVSQYNSLQISSAKKAKVVAIEQPIDPALQKLLNMLEYAGLVRPSGAVSRGVKGRFSRYTIHYSLLLSENALRLGKSVAIQEPVKALTNKNPHAFARTKGVKLLGEGYANRCTLDLPACQNCLAPRISEEQRFCMRCGHELSEASIYAELLHAPVSVLALPQKKIDGIADSSSLRTVQDILLDDELQLLRKVRGIGPVWSRKIRTAAEEFAGV
jgi:hypothetical protein